MFRIQTFDALAIQISLFYGFILFGYVVARLSGKGSVVNKHLNSLLINILVPLLIFYVLLTSTPSSLVEIPVYLLITVTIHILGPVLIFLRLRGSEMKTQTKGSLYICSTFNNAIFIPLPLVLMFLGPAGVPFVVLFSLTQMILYATVGSVMGASFSEKDAGWKKIARDAFLFPPFLAAILALIFLAAGIGLPSIVTTVLSYNSALTTYLALLSVGLGVGIRFSLADIHIALNVIVSRQLIIPLITLPILIISGLSQIPFQVLLLESLMPPAILAVAYTSGFGLDVETASTTVTVGTILLLPMIPLFPLFLG
ncbi:MAG: AEC family transporter [Candidatus Thorarchaeota archaeon]